MNNEERITIKDGIGVGEQRQLIETTRGLMAALTREEFIQIMKVYNITLNRLAEQARKEGIEI